MILYIIALAVVSGDLCWVPQLFIKAGLYLSQYHHVVMISADKAWQCSWRDAAHTAH